MKKQLGRRNLTDAQKTYLIGRQYEAQKTSGVPISNKNQCAQNEHIVKADGERVNRTAQAIAKEHGIGREAVKRTEKIDHSPQKVKNRPGAVTPRAVRGQQTDEAYCPPIITNAGGKSNGKKSKYPSRVWCWQHPAAA